MEISERFWSHVDKGEPNECWHCALTPSQYYPRFHIDNDYDESAHRMAWLLTTGKIPNDMLVLHKCGNPRCANPNHLYLGSRSDNMRDYIERHGHWDSETR